MAAFLGVALLGVLPWHRIAVALSGPRRLQPGLASLPGVLGRIDGLKGYHYTSGHPQAKTYRAWRTTGSTARCSSPTPTPSGTRCWRLAESDPRPKWILVAAEPITDIDTTAADMLDDWTAG